MSNRRFVGIWSKITSALKNKRSTKQRDLSESELSDKRPKKNARWKRSDDRKWRTNRHQWMMIEVMVETIEEALVDLRESVIDMMIAGLLHAGPRWEAVGMTNVVTTVHRDAFKAARTVVWTVVRNVARPGASLAVTVEMTEVDSNEARRGLARGMRGWTITTTIALGVVRRGTIGSVPIDRSMRTDRSAARQGVTTTVQFVVHHVEWTATGAWMIAHQSAVHRAAEMMGPCAALCEEVPCEVVMTAVTTYVAHRVTTTAAMTGLRDDSKAAHRAITITSDVEAMTDHHQCEQEEEMIATFSVDHREEWMTDQELVVPEAHRDGLSGGQEMKKTTRENDRLYVGSTIGRHQAVMKAAIRGEAMPALFAANHHAKHHHSDVKKRHLLPNRPLRQPRRRQKTTAGRS